MDNQTLSEVLAQAEAAGAQSVMDAHQGVSTHASSPRLQKRVVREPGRDTWFVVNESEDDITAIPIECPPECSVRRVNVNGELAHFTSSPEVVIVRPEQPLRAGAGTLVVVQFR